ncbi:glycosyltransferase family 2 protein [Novosphingobium aquimarinum]|uniref:glycosyltransferase family 2 protein n=1 Tax=Novosphingobium aquimarinum TaxID=2682494 RepID=UPI0012ECA79E|nr:glycosyltransferase family A protein [Novosphingobium aquimarinum]
MDVDATPTEATAVRISREGPRVSVIVPAYGVAHLLKEALRSLQVQTLADWECIVIDDGAPDDVATAVTPFLADQRIRFLSTENQGVSAARNTAIRASHAPLVALLDGDDLLRPTYLEKMVAALEADPSARFASCNARIFGAVPEDRLCFTRPQGDARGRGTLANVLDRSYGVYIGAMFWRADFDAVGGFDEAMAHAEDFDFWVRLLQLGGHARFVDEVLGDYRIRSSSASAVTLKMIAGNIRVYEKARTKLPEGAPEIALIDALLAEQYASVAFETAVNAVIAHSSRERVGRLQTAHDRVRHGAPSIMWNAAYALWKLAPPLAPPMLRWRRAMHRRGNGGNAVQALTSILSSRRGAT